MTRGLYGLLRLGHATGTDTTKLEELEAEAERLREEPGALAGVD